MKIMIVHIFINLITGYYLRLIPYCDQQKMTGAPTARYFNRNVHTSFEGSLGFTTDLRTCIPRMKKPVQAPQKMIKSKKIVGIPIQKNIMKPQMPKKNIKQKIQPKIVKPVQYYVQPQVVTPKYQKPATSTSKVFTTNQQLINVLPVRYVEQSTKTPSTKQKKKSAKTPTNNVVALPPSPPINIPPIQPLSQIQPILPPQILQLQPISPIQPPQIQPISPIRFPQIPSMPQNCVDLQQNTGKESANCYSSSSSSNIKVSENYKKENSSFISLRNLCNMKIVPFFMECDPYKLHTIRINSSSFHISSDLIGNILKNNGITDKELISKSTGLSLEEIRRISILLDEITPQAYNLKDEIINCFKNKDTGEYTCTHLKCQNGICKESNNEPEPQYKQNKYNILNINLPIINEDESYVKNTITIETIKTKDKTLIESENKYEEEPKEQYKKPKYLPYMEFEEDKNKNTVEIDGVEPENQQTNEEETNEDIKNEDSARTLVNKIFYADRQRNKIFDILSNENENIGGDQCDTSDPNYNSKECVKVVRMSDLMRGRYLDPCLEMFKNKINKISEGNFAYCSLTEPSNYENGDSMLYLSELI
ncbi:uncharacterized protein VNE69_07274 [Vairimorpha necatrix]|uniref:Uncharacterized protein n=1 Tax=Vairimorpha necatrix TaxID=6039 RepID=A0AAX4JEE6_9MICR